MRKRPQGRKPAGGLDRPSEREEGDVDGPSIMVAVDRREGEVVVVVDDLGRATDVDRPRMPMAARVEGAILRVPLDGAGKPRWEEATRDRAEERRRRAALERRIRRLEGTDPGGDVEL